MTRHTDDDIGFNERGEPFMLGDDAAAPSPERKQDDHYTYDGVYDWRGRRTGLRASLNPGHTGSVLSCRHPACVAIQNDDHRWTDGR